MSIERETAAALRALREARGLTVEDVVFKLRALDRQRSATTIYSWERDGTIKGGDLIFYLTRVLGVSFARFEAELDRVRLDGL